MKNIRLYLFGTGLTLLMMTAGCTHHTASAADHIITLPAGTLSTDQVVELFSGKTVESVTAVRGRTSLSYYDPNGEVRQTRNEKTRTGHWRVSKNGRICLQMEDLPEKCRIIVFEEGEYRKYIVKKNGQHQHSVSYRKFIEGNPYGL